MVLAISFIHVINDSVYFSLDFVLIGSHWNLDVEYFRIWEIQKISYQEFGKYYWTTQVKLFGNGHSILWKATIFTKVY